MVLLVISGDFIFHEITEPIFTIFVLFSRNFNGKLRLDIFWDLPRSFSRNFWTIFTLERSCFLPPTLKSLSAIPSRKFLATFLKLLSISSITATHFCLTCQNGNNHRIYWSLWPFCEYELVISRKLLNQPPSLSRKSLNLRWDLQVKVCENQNTSSSYLDLVPFVTSNFGSEAALGPPSTFHFSKLDTGWLWKAQTWILHEMYFSSHFLLFLFSNGNTF